MNHLRAQWRMAALDYEIERTTYSDPFVRDGESDHLIRLSDDGVLYTAKIPGDDYDRSIGWLRLRRRLSDGVWEVWRVRVEDQYQRQGVASALMASARADLGRIEHAPEDERTSDGKAWINRVGARDWVRVEIEETGKGFSNHMVMVTGYMGAERVGWLQATHDFYPKGPEYACWQVWNLSVEEAYRRQGVATRMLEELHKAYPNHMILHGGFVSEEGEAWARSLPRSWNRVSRRALGQHFDKLYHGTHATLAPGTQLVAGQRQNFDEHLYGGNAKMVFMAESAEMAFFYAVLAGLYSGNFGGSHVYEVTADEVSYSQPGEWVAPEATVVREVTAEARSAMKATWLTEWLPIIHEMVPEGPDRRITVHEFERALR